MNKVELSNIKIGDTVVITQHGKNQGKKGSVVSVNDRTVYLIPVDCEFEFTNNSAWRLHRRDEGIYGFSYVSINYPDKMGNKTGLETYSTKQLKEELRRRKHL